MTNQPGLDPTFYESDRRAYDGAFPSEPLALYTAKTFGWMFLGLLVTFSVSILLIGSGLIFNFLRMGYAGLFLLMIAEVGVVMYLSTRIDRMSINMARGMFFAYAALNGFTFSSIFLVFDVSILLFVFGLTALYFGVLALYGWITKSDLSRLAPVLTTGLIFLAVCWVISMFLPIGSFDRVICLGGLLVFMGLTAYDTQKIKHLHAMYENDYAMSRKASIFAALQLYLDFINIFMYILRLVGRSNRD